MYLLHASLPPTYILLLLPPIYIFLLPPNPSLFYLLPKVLLHPLPLCLSLALPLLPSLSISPSLPPSFHPRGISHHISLIRWKTNLVYDINHRFFILLPVSKAIKKTLFYITLYLLQTSGILTTQ